MSRRWNYFLEQIDFEIPRYHKEGMIEWSRFDVIDPAPGLVYRTAKFENDVFTLGERNNHFGSFCFKKTWAVN